MQMEEPWAEMRLGDCLDELKELPDNSVDAIVSDPPYGLSKEPDMAEVLRHWLAGDDYKHKGKGFMGKTWDSFVPGPSVWRECLRVLKPGGYLVSFFGTRTYDMGTLAIRLAGFEVRDQLAWVYGSGFPKSHDVAKAVHAHITCGGSSPKKRRQAEMGESYTLGDTAGLIGVERAQERVRSSARPIDSDMLHSDARSWQGWGTALKPAWEPICLARKPLIGTVAANVLEHGTGALNIDGCRVPGAYETRDRDNSGGASMFGTGAGGGAFVPANGRWPANLIHDGSDEVVGLFPDSKGQQGDVRGTEPSRTGGEGTNCYGEYGRVPAAKRNDGGGSAARFFYCAKASKSDREAGNLHPTVKPTALIQWLVRMVTPPGGTVLDPFMGSGSTGKACMIEDFNFIGIEMDEGYMDIAEARIIAAKAARKEEQR
jgi:DNA modification methylase